MISGSTSSSFSKLLFSISLRRYIVSIGVLGSLINSIRDFHSKFCHFIAANSAICLRRLGAHSFFDHVSRKFNPLSYPATFLN
ncbi:TPA: hypothetical protein DIC40_00515 [Patescibacteria group bacterium]|nr:hypothetical protein [Candidatus Gracilibacteria bacterium]